MRKWVFIGFIGLIITRVWIAPLYTTSPDMDDFVHWFEETYSVQCEDDSCDSFNLIGDQTNIYVNEEGYMKQSSGFFTFNMEVRGLYRSVEEPERVGTIEVRWNQDSFEVMEETGIFVTSP
ncbi:conserved hypothetical protein [Exiguobacterium sp. 8H]|uniref:hypothetical protein n=1 Tax=unclassified Exiguobacterium TaxID=2644629 RepID=UPI0012F36426|nr:MULTISPECIES: hypothetical protein [unclassified Exiguobacterium]VXA94307.1 conserved hypothetical protein [Exiguobacterium sp. 8A]VXA95203.1 conserved hypothetical protein [Exiguobacterium sp. 8H]